MKHMYGTISSLVNLQAVSRKLGRISIDLFGNLNIYFAIKTDLKILQLFHSTLVCLNKIRLFFKTLLNLIYKLRKWRTNNNKKCTKTIYPKIDGYVSGLIGNAQCNIRLNGGNL